jgi:hypothetical protein
MRPGGLALCYGSWANGITEELSMATERLCESALRLFVPEEVRSKIRGQSL